jgi:tyrosinase
MTKDARKLYIKAVLCLMSAPSKLVAGKFPGAHNRYEDFVVVHMQQTLTIHNTVC